MTAARCLCCGAELDDDDRAMCVPCSDKAWALELRERARREERRAAASDQAPGPTALYIQCRPADAVCTAAAGGGPDMANTPGRSVRISDELWQAAKVAAARDGRTVTDVIVEALTRYVEGTWPR